LMAISKLNGNIMSSVSMFFWDSKCHEDHWLIFFRGVGIPPSSRCWSQIFNLLLASIFGTFRRYLEWTIDDVAGILVSNDGTRIPMIQRILMLFNRDVTNI
jgi:hypothetical protein